MNRGIDTCDNTFHVHVKVPAHRDWRAYRFLLILKGSSCQPFWLQYHFLCILCEMLSFSLSVNSYFVLMQNDEVSIHRRSMKTTLPCRMRHDL